MFYFYVQKSYSWLESFGIIMSIAYDCFTKYIIYIACV